VRVFVVLIATSLLCAVPLTSPVIAKDGCPAGMKRECMAQSYPPKAPPACRCVVDPGATGSGNQGKAEVKKRNVPQAKKTKNPGPND